MLKKLLESSSLRRKLIILHFIMIVVFTVVSFYTIFNSKVVLIRLKAIIGEYVYLSDLRSDINLLETELEKYLTTKTSNSILNYYTVYNRLQQKSSKISREVVKDENKLMLKNIGFMIDNLLLETDNAVLAKRGRISSEYITHFSRVKEISGHIKFYINNLLDSSLYSSSKEYTDINKNMSYAAFLNFFLIILTLIISIAIAIIITYQLTKPIIKLSHAAERISKGDFDIEPIDINSKDEINILAQSFNKMVINTREYIYEIKNQAKVERKLKEQEMQNLKMKSLLKDAELKMLQSQINPHFLFNTLNTASQLSFMEGAEKSSEFIEKLAELFRYSLKKIDEAVPLSDELRNVETYMYILKTRFGDKINFEVDVDEGVLGARIPCTSIQPIIENAYIHGLEDIEENGEIRLIIKVNGDKITITVLDNGKGMDRLAVESVLKGGKSKDYPKKHVSGIGMSNVIDRLRLFYNLSDIDEVIEIESKENFGTRVTLKIPYSKEVIKNAKALNS